MKLVKIWTKRPDAKKFMNNNENGLSFEMSPFFYKIILRRIELYRIPPPRLYPGTGSAWKKSPSVQESRACGQRR